MKLDDFIKEYCFKKCCLYKSPSCNPKDINYRSDCEFWKEIRKEELKKNLSSVKTYQQRILTSWI